MPCVAVSTVKPQAARSRFGILADVILVIGIDDGRMRDRRVQIKRHVERLGALEDRPESTIIEKQAIAQSMHHCPLEAESGDGAFQFVRRRLGICCRQHREGGETVWMRAHGLAEPVIGGAGQPDREFRIRNFLDRGRAVRQNLDINPGRVHFGNSTLADIFQPCCDTGPAGSISSGDMLLHLGIEVVLFKRDHLRPHAHFFLPAPSPGWGIVTIRRGKIEPRR